MRYPLSSDRRFSHRETVVCFCLIMALQAFGPNHATAAFIMRHKKSTEPRAVTTAMHPERQALRNGSLKEFLFRKAQGFQRYPGPHSVDMDNPTFGIISFVAGLIGLACALLIAGSVGSFAIVAIGAFAAITAIICGAIGLKRQMKGLAIIGMTLGILEILVGLIIVAVVIAWVGGW